MGRTPSTSDLTPFGRWLARNGKTYVAAAEALGVTRSYVQMLASGRATPKLGLAFRLEDWTRKVSGDAVEVGSWRPWVA